MPLPAAVPIALAAGSLLSSFFGNKKKKNEQKKVTATNNANTMQYRTATAAREDAINKALTDVLNQQEAATARRSQTRNGLAQSLLSSLQESTIDKGAASQALSVNSGYNPIKHTVAPPNVVKPIDMEVDPGTGDTWDAFSKVFDGLASSAIEKKAVDAAQKAAEMTKVKSLWGENLEKLPWDID